MNAYPLTQLELRFTQILNFNQIIRELMSPYLRLTTSFNINNDAKFGESIRINFEDDPFFIDCRWDRIIFLTQDDPKRFIKANSTIKIFWEIVEKLSQLSSFGKFTNAAFLNYEIKIIDDTQQGILAKFKKKYLSGEIEKILPSSSDAAVTLESIASEKQISVTYGAFSHNDIQKHNLFPFSPNETSNFIDKFGTLFRIQIVEPYSKLDTEVLKKYIDEKDKSSSQFII